MDSLLASYASSDEEQEDKPKLSNPKSAGFLSSLPPPKSSSSSSSSPVSFPLPPPKSHPPKPSISSSSSTLNPHKSNELQEEESSRHSASLPKPSPSLFASLPRPKSSSTSSLFSSLPPPTKTHNPDAGTPPSAQSARKRVVQFKPPPINSSTNVGNEGDDEDDDEDEDQKQKKQPVVQTASVKSFLSSIPAPRNSATLGALPSASGSSRRSIIDADVPGLKNSEVMNAVSGSEAGVSTSTIGCYEGQSSNNQTSMSSGGDLSNSAGYASGGGGDYSSWGYGSENYANHAGYGAYENNGGSAVAGDYQNWDGGNGDSVNYSGDYGGYANYGQYESNWADVSTAAGGPEVSGFAENALRVSGKRGRNNVPEEIVEVKQDELMKNRPREDQVKLTGIAFGPAYQPTSAKGKPSKVHKRKHQIGSLYFDMKQKEMELSERRARGFLTKAQTQGKYGW